MTGLEGPHRAGASAKFGMGRDAAPLNAQPAISESTDRYQGNQCNQFLDNAAEFANIMQRDYITPLSSGFWVGK